MTAGQGIRHSEYNPSQTEPVRLIQVWIEPSQRGLTPAYAQQAFPIQERINKLTRVAGPESSTDRALRINQDAHIYVATLQAGIDLNFEVKASRGVWIQIIKGACGINGESVQAGDGIAFEDEGQVSLKGEADTTEILLFDLP
jgi:redox-sensitive bicupin YhaK (pirin superfamily)